MTSNPDGEPRFPQPAEISPATVEALWHEANTLTAHRRKYPIVGCVDVFLAVIDGGPADVAVMVHPESPADDGVIGSISVSPERGNPDIDTTHYQFLPSGAGMTLRKLLPVDFTRADFNEPRPVSPDEVNDWMIRREVARIRFEDVQRAEHDFLGLATIYEPEAGQLMEAMRLRRAQLESPAPAPAAAKANWISALVRRWLKR